MEHRDIGRSYTRSALKTNFQRIGAFFRYELALGPDLLIKLQNPGPPEKHRPVVKTHIRIIRCRADPEHTAGNEQIAAVKAEAHGIDPGGTVKFHPAAGDLHPSAFFKRKLIAPRILQMPERPVSDLYAPSAALSAFNAHPAAHPGKIGNTAVNDQLSSAYADYLRRFRRRAHTFTFAVVRKPASLGDLKFAAVADGDEAVLHHRIRLYQKLRGSRPAVAKMKFLSQIGGSVDLKRIIGAVNGNKHHA